MAEEVSPEPVAQNLPEARLYRPGAWSIVTQAPDWDPALVRKKLDELTTVFWRPAYAYIRYAAGLKRKEALRATERYLTSFSETPLHLMSPEVRSRFRIFTRTSVKIFVATGRHQEQGEEPPGLRRLDPPPEGGEITQELEAAHDADEAFDREWVRALFDRASQTLRQKLEGSGELIFERVLSEYDLQPPSETPVSLSVIARNLDITRVDARVSLAYARTVLRRILLSLVNDTLIDPNDMEREVKELVEISKGDGPPWALIRRIFPADDEFMLLQLVLESGSLTSSQMRELAQLMELSGTHITKALTEMGTLQPSQLEPLLALKESRINAILQIAAATRQNPIVREEIPDGLEDLMRDSRNFLGKFLKIEPMTEEEGEKRWRCYDTQTKRYVSVTLLDATQMDKAVSRDLVLASQLQHPNIVPVLDFGNVGNQTYVASALVAGESLRGKRLSERRALEIVYEIARAVEDAHTRGLSHGSLSANSVILDRDGHVNITDFGLGKLDRPRPDSADEPSPTIPGNGQADTNFLMPGVSEAEVRIDVLGLGAILYELLTGKDSLEGATPYDSLRNPREWISVRRYNTDARFGVDDLVRRALRGDESERFQSCREFGMAILRMLKGETIELPAAKAEPVKSKWTTAMVVRRGLLALAVFVVVLLSFAVGRGSGGSSADDHLRRANAAFDAGRFEDAMQHYAAVIALRPGLKSAEERYQECRRRLGPQSPK